MYLFLAYSVFAVYPSNAYCCELCSAATYIYTAISVLFAVCTNVSSTCSAFLVVLSFVRYFNDVQNTNTFWAGGVCPFAYPQNCLMDFDKL
jgi:hypothetical protein